MSDVICCDVLAEMVANVGERGYALLVVRRGENFVFLLQFRTVARHVESTVVHELATRGGLGANVFISGAVAIKFCPFCGTSLQKHVDRDKSTFAALARDHEEYLSAGQKY